MCLNVFIRYFCGERVVFDLFFCFFEDSSWMNLVDFWNVFWWGGGGLGMFGWWFYEIMDLRFFFFCIKWSIVGV